MNRSIAARITSLIVSHSPFFTSCCRLWIFSGGMRIVTLSDSGGIAAGLGCLTKSAVSSDKSMAFCVFKADPLHGDPAGPRGAAAPPARPRRPPRVPRFKLKDREGEPPPAVRDVADDDLRQARDPHLD